MMMMMRMMMMLMSGPNIKLHNNYPVMDVFVFKVPATQCTGSVECGQALSASARLHSNLGASSAGILFTSDCLYLCVCVTQSARVRIACLRGISEA